MLNLCQTIGLGAALLGLTACGGSTSAPDSQLALTNAIAIDEGQYPAVVMIFKPGAPAAVYCTAAFINDHQALTAAHCLGEPGSDRSDVYYVRPTRDADGKGVVQAQARAVRAHVHSGYDQAQREEISPYDLAVLDFPGGTAPGVLKLGSKSPAINDRVTLIGFGGEETEKNGIQGASSMGDKRFGSNTIQSAERGLVGLSGLSRSRRSYPLGQHVASAQGDSGSPWLLDGQLTSITIGGEIKQKGQGQELSFTYAVDLNSESSQAFLSSVLD